VRRDNTSFLRELQRRNVIRVCVAYVAVAWLLVQVVETVLPVFGVGESALRIIFILLGVGLLPTLVLAWVYELTPEGVRKERDVDRSLSITPRTGRKLDRVIMVVLTLALGYFVADKFIFDPARDQARIEAARNQAVTEALEYEAGDRSIAVLPFLNMSNNPDNTFFSDGVSEELLNLLAQAGGLTVASRTSSFSFKGKDLDIPQIADRLRVRHVLEGSVRWAGNQVRVTAQLIDARTDKHLWSQTYDRELQDIFAVQDEIATSIVAALREQFGAEAGLGEPTGLSQTRNIEAYQLYLRGISLLRLRSIENLQQAASLLERAVGLDPDYARAWSQLAVAYSLVPFYSHEPRPPWLKKGRIAAERAMELDPTLAGPHATLGYIYQFTENMSSDRVEEEYLRAIELDPRHVRSRQWFGEFLMRVGKARLMLEQFQAAHELDPLAPVINSALAWGYLYNGDFEKAERFARTALELGMGGTWAEDTLGLVYLYTHRYADALEVFSRDYRDFELNRLVVRANMDPKLVPEAVAAIEAVDYFRISFWPVELMFLIGEGDRGLDRALEQAREGHGDLRSIWRPHFLMHARDPRFKELVSKYGLVEYWQKTGWPDFCRPAADDFSCDAAYYAQLD
jgi:TolB-like protein/Tfp pilus assembly protein PilF